VKTKRVNVPRNYSYLCESYSNFPGFFVLVLRPKGSTRTRGVRTIEYEYEYHCIEYEDVGSQKDMGNGKSQCTQVTRPPGGAAKGRAALN
jgi:hypothetical protein